MARGNQMYDSLGPSTTTSKTKKKKKKVSGNRRLPKRSLTRKRPK